MFSHWYSGSWGHFMAETASSEPRTTSRKPVGQLSLVFDLVKVERKLVSLYF